MLLTMKFKLSHNISLVALAVLSLFATSCTTSKEIVYFQDQKLHKNDPIIFSEFKYKPNDILTIDVAALDEEVVRPFNLAPVSYNFNTLSVQNNLTRQTYYVDKNGEIDFPVLGKIKIGGLTRDEATNMLKEKIIPYVKDPIITIRVTNFTITVLGEVNNPGTFIIQDERVSFTEALGLAGDLSIYGRRDNVFLIREDDKGIKTYTSLDLTTINSISTSKYYLEQNDVIYVEPNKAKIRSATYNQNNNVLISAVATLATIVAILIR